MDWAELFVRIHSLVLAFICQADARTKGHVR